MDNGIKLYVKQHGDTVAGKKIEFIRKDVGGVAPDVAKRLAQELIVRDKVDIIAGFALTPNALAVGRRLRRGEEVHGGDECGDLDHHDQVALYRAHLGDHCRSSTRRSAPGRPRTASRTPTPWSPTTARASTPRGAFQTGFKEAGGEIVGSVRFPVANPDFSAFVQRAKDFQSGGGLHLVPGGAQPAALGKALAERGIDPPKTKVMGQDGSTDESALKSMGDAALGIITVVQLRLPVTIRPMNEEFVKAYNDECQRATPTSSRSAATTACT